MFKMCQLAAYIGDRSVASLLLRALENQEPLYGGHATGIGVIGEGGFKITKAAGPVAHVKRVKPEISKLEGTCAVAHSRYSDSARGNPDYNLDEMAHPFTGDDGKIALMHNGMISNYKELWEKLEGRHTFRSYGEKVNDITDSEVAVHMLSDAYGEGMSMVEAFQSITPHLEGTFLLAAMNVDFPDTIYIANWYQPCYVAVNESEALFVSSRRGLGGFTDHLDRVFQPPKNSIIRMTRGRVDVYVMDASRKVPWVRMNQFEARRLIIKALEENSSMDVRRLFNVLQPEGWAKVYGLPVEDWVKLCKAGVYVRNPYFELLEDMVADGDLDERVDPRMEGGVRDVPRFSYSLP